jgi:hypothetical protein
MRSQVACYLFDRKARLKCWDSVFIAASSDTIGVGSSKRKALARALCHSIAANKAHIVIPLAGCSVSAVSEHHGRRHVMVVTVPRVGDSIFSFYDSATRDAMVHRLQVRFPLITVCAWRRILCLNSVCLAQDFVFELNES